MKREAIAVWKNGAWAAEIVRGEACGSCHACAYGQKEKLHFPLPDGEYTEGETVIVDVDDRALGRATFAAYVVPLLFFLGGLGIGCLLFGEEWAQALTAILFLAAGLLAVKITEKKRRASGIYACRAQRSE